MVRVALLVLAVVALAPAAALADGGGGPQPPCDRPTVPAYGAIDGTPVTGAWNRGDLERERWQPPACLGWQADSRLVVALASRFRSPLSLDQLGERLTAISDHRAIKYWTVTHRQWRPLVLDSSLIDGPGGKFRLPDPPREKLVAGRSFFYAEDADVGGRTVYRLSVLARTPDRLVVASENVTSIRVAIITLFEPGALQVVSFLEREGPESWALYEITRAAAGSSAFVTGYRSSYLNRLDALRRYVVGLPTDREPPIAPW